MIIKHCPKCQSPVIKIEFLHGEIQAHIECPKCNEKVLIESEILLTAK